MADFSLPVAVLPDADDRFEKQPANVVIFETLPGALVPSRLLVRESEWPMVRDAMRAAMTPATLAAAIGCKAATILSALQPADVTMNQPLTAEQVAALLAAMAEGAR